MKYLILALLLLGSCSPQLKKNSYNVGRSGAYWEKKKTDRAHGKKGKKLTYYVGSWGMSAACPVYGRNPIQRGNMKKLHYSRVKY